MTDQAEENSRREIEKLDKYIDGRVLISEKYLAKRLRAMYEQGKFDAIAEARKGYKPKQELVCEICDCHYPVWFAPNELWNKVMRHPDGKEASEKHSFVCMDCFASYAEKLGVKPLAWTLTAQADVDRAVEAQKQQEREVLTKIKIHLDGSNAGEVGEWYGDSDAADVVNKRLAQLTPPHNATQPSCELCKTQGGHSPTCWLYDENRKPAQSQEEK